MDESSPVECNASTEETVRDAVALQCTKDFGSEPNVLSGLRPLLEPITKHGPYGIYPAVFTGIRPRAWLQYGPGKSRN